MSSTLGDRDTLLTLLAFLVPHSSQFQALNPHQILQLGLLSTQDSTDERHVSRLEHEDLEVLPS